MSIKSFFEQHQDTLIPLIVIIVVSLIGIVIGVVLDQLFISQLFRLIH
jgi:hypothetical protein